MELKGVMGGFYRISEWIMRFAVANILWVVTSLFIPVFLLFGMLSSPNADSFKSLLLLIAIISPVVLFPATSAMFALVRKWLIGQEDAPLFKTFFQAYKENFLQSLLGGILYVLIFTILSIAYTVYKNQSNFLAVLSILTLIIIAVTVASLLNFFCLQVHLHMKLFQRIKNAFILTIASPINTICTLIVTIGIVIITYFKFTFFIFIGVGSLSAYISFWFFYRLFIKLQEKHKDMESEEQIALNSEDQETTATS